MNTVRLSSTADNTPKFNEITDPYGLSLNGKWNVEEVSNHLGRHTIPYHEYMLEQITIIDGKANGDVALFLQLFRELIIYIMQNTEIMYMK